VLAMSQVYLGDAAAYQVKLRREREATPAKVQAAAKRWLSDGEYVAEVFPFGDPQASTTAADRNQPPAIAQPPELRLPKLERTTLSNGLKVVLAERHEIPLVSFSLLVDSGYSADQGCPLGPGLRDNPGRRRWFRSCSTRAPRRAARSRSPSNWRNSAPR